MALAQHLKEASTVPMATDSVGSRVRWVMRRSSSNICLWNMAASASRAICLGESKMMPYIDGRPATRASFSDASALVCILTERNEVAGSAEVFLPESKATHEAKGKQRRRPRCPRSVAVSCGSSGLMLFEQVYHTVKAQRKE